MLVFAAPDADAIPSTFDEARKFLGWKSIADDAEQAMINLDAGQQRQAQKSRDDSSATLDQRLADAYRWLLAPTQDGTNPLEWTAVPLGGGDLTSTGSVAVRASTKLATDGLLITKTWSPLLLRRELDQWIWVDGSPHVSLKRVWEYLATYPYFTRLRDTNVLVAAVESGVQSREYFGYADGVEGNKYHGLVFGARAPIIAIDEASVLVRPDVAEQAVPPEVPAAGDGREAMPTPTKSGERPKVPDIPPEPAAPRRFYGTIRLNPNRLSSSAGQVGEEIVQHLNALPQADVEVVLELHVRVPEGVPENVMRIVSENAAALKFDQFGFEEE
jgi:hypothetical protein